MTVWECLATCDWTDRHPCGHPRQTIDGHRLPCAECARAPFWYVAVRQPLQFGGRAEPHIYKPGFTKARFDLKMCAGMGVPAVMKVWAPESGAPRVTSRDNR